MSLKYLLHRLTSTHTQHDQELVSEMNFFAQGKKNQPSATEQPPKSHGPYLETIMFTVHVQVSMCECLPLPASKIYFLKLHLNTSEGSILEYCPSHSLSLHHIMPAWLINNKWYSIPNVNICAALSPEAWPMSPVTLRVPRHECHNLLRALQVEVAASTPGTQIQWV